MYSVEHRVEDGTQTTELFYLMSYINSFSHGLNNGFFHLPSGTCYLRYVLLIYICCLFQLQSGCGGEKGGSELV